MSFPGGLMLLAGLVAFFPAAPVAKGIARVTLTGSAAVSRDLKTITVGRACAAFVTALENHRPSPRRQKERSA